MPCGGCNGKTLVKGAVGVAKAALGIDRAPEAVIKARLDICRECPEATRNPERMNLPSKGLTSRSRCLKCKCWLVLKTKVKGETCPLGKW